MQNYTIKRLADVDSSRIYGLDLSGTTNSYYIISSPDAMDLIINPETIGYRCQRCLLPSTQSFLQYLQQSETIRRPHIFNILRGGLNFPLEEAAYNIGMKVCTTDFVSCERVLEGGEIKGLSIGYEKLIAEQHVTLLIGDIIASGETLLECIPLIARRYKAMGGSIQKIIFFTIGGTKAVTLMERLTHELKALWPDFDGFRCIFYEGMFTVYEDSGVSGINTPNIDFGWKGGAIAPDMRRRMMSQPWSLLEKCTIYDGGARRYEIHHHIAEVCEYWQALSQMAEGIDFKSFVEEKIGYPLSASYEEWLSATHLPSSDGSRQLYGLEQTTISRLLTHHTLSAICVQRLHDFRKAMEEFRS